MVEATRTPQPRPEADESSTVVATVPPNDAVEAEILDPVGVALARIQSSTDEFSVSLRAHARAERQEYEAMTTRLWSEREEGIRGNEEKRQALQAQLNELNEQTRITFRAIDKEEIARPAQSIRALPGQQLVKVMTTLLEEFHPDFRPLIDNTPADSWLDVREAAIQVMCDNRTMFDSLLHNYKINPFKIEPELIALLKQIFSNYPLRINGGSFTYGPSEDFTIKREDAGKTARFEWGRQKVLGLVIPSHAKSLHDVLQDATRGQADLQTWLNGLTSSRDVISTLVDFLFEREAHTKLVEDGKKGSPEDILRALYRVTKKRQIRADYSTKKAKLDKARNEVPSAPESHAINFQLHERFLAGIEYPNLANFPLVQKQFVRCAQQRILENERHFPLDGLKVQVDRKALMEMRNATSGRFAWLWKLLDSGESVEAEAEKPDSDANHLYTLYHAAAGFHKIGVSLYNHAADEAQKKLGLDLVFFGRGLSIELNRMVVQLHARMAVRTIMNGIEFEGFAEFAEAISSFSKAPMSGRVQGVLDDLFMEIDAALEVEATANDAAKKL
jgi:hypothetical protein